MNKVTIEEVKANMQDVICSTAIEFDKPVTYVTVRMKNGFTLRESTTCVDPANYDEEVGKQICLEKIEDKIWFLLGYALQDKIYKETNSTFESRMIEEYKQLGDRLGKLNTALGKDGFKDKVGEVQYNLMCTQDKAMTEYWNTLRDRMLGLGIKFEE
jgi:hypothetical protein